MTPRERVLSLTVGGLLVSVGLWWGIGKYRDSLQSREEEIARLENLQQESNEQQLAGEYANRQMGEYMVRSLPGNAEAARGRYQQWLLGIMQNNQLKKQSVDPASSPRLIADLYRQWVFRVQGQASTANLINLLHDFYAKDYLHRIRTLSVRPNRSGEFDIEMMVDVIALKKAPLDLPDRKEPGWAVTQSAERYRETILNRNFFEPPNQPPQFAGKAKVNAVVGPKFVTIPLVFKDPEKHPLAYELTGPSNQDDVQVELNPKTGTLRVQSEVLKPIELTVRAIDSGYPKRSTEQNITVHFVQPPPPPKPPAPKLKFDDAKQTVLTGLVQGRNEWTAWMHVRTRGKTLKLRVGDSFEVGSVKGKVVEVNRHHAMLEIDGQRYELRPHGKLSELAAE